MSCCGVAEPLSAQYARIKNRIRDGVAGGGSTKSLLYACFMALRPQMMAEIVVVRMSSLAITAGAFFMSSRRIQ